MTVNAPFGHRAGLRVDGLVRYLGWAVPEAVYVDLDVIASAPPALNRSGVGDILCYHTAHSRLAARPTTSAGRSRAGRTTSGSWPPPGSGSTRCSGALDDIRDVTEEGIRTLMLAHRWGGATFHDSGWNPRHIEGVDHFLFYNLERITGRHFIHGQPVGLGHLRSARCCRTTSRPRCWPRCTGPASTSGPRRWASPGTTSPRPLRTLGGTSARPGCGSPSPTSARSTTSSSRGSATGSRPPYGPWEDGAMKAGLTLPQGCDREYLGLDARDRVGRTVEVAQRAEALGFESLWVYDHMQVDPPPEEAIVFDPFVELAALAMATSRARLGHLVSAAAYRNAGAHRQDDLDDRRGQRRPGDPRHRRRLEGGRVARLRLRLPAGAGRGSASWPTTWRSSPGCWRRAGPPTRARTPT